MHFLLLTLLLLLIIFAPQWWARYTFKRYAAQRDYIPGSGGELARHLLKRFDMENVAVELTAQGDHYDPGRKTVRLSEANYYGKSLTAIAIAAHEVGHAVQHHQGSPWLALRSRLVVFAQFAERFSSLAMMAIPVVAIATRAPSSGFLMLSIGVASMLLSTLIHLVTLPVEWDASFGKALPILRDGYISQDDEPVVRKILKAAALTYVAASLMSLINFRRWFSMWRRSR